MCFDSSGLSKECVFRHCSRSERRANDEKNGEGPSKAGNKYLAWAFIEAAHFAQRYHPPMQRFHERKRARTNGIVAIKAVANKLARASFYVRCDGVPFEMERAFQGVGGAVSQHRGWQNQRV